MPSYQFIPFASEINETQSGSVDDSELVDDQVSDDDSELLVQGMNIEKNVCMP